MTIRPLLRAEVEERLDAFLEIAADVEGEYWQAKHFLDDRPRKWKLSLAAWADNRPVGYAILSERAADHVHLHHFMVARDLRGGGLGGKLADEMIAAMRQAGYIRLTLKVGEANGRAQAFYRRLGFEPGETQGGYRWYSLELRKSVFRGQVAMHQPNYAPWLGYFHKMARADLLVLLDDVQFSKGSYINRVQILGSQGPRWLTQPVSAKLGTPIRDVTLSKPGWRRSHLDSLRGAYKDARSFSDVWPEMQSIYANLPEGGLAEVNHALVAALAGRLGIETRIQVSSAVETGPTSGDDRLIAIMASLAPGGTYLSGKGGDKYQDPAKFAAAGIKLDYAGFEHPRYAQGRDFVPGLSVLDAVFHLGWDRTAALVSA